MNVRDDKSNRMLKVRHCFKFFLFVKFVLKFVTLVYFIKKKTQKDVSAWVFLVGDFLLGVFGCHLSPYQGIAEWLFDENAEL